MPRRRKAPAAAGHIKLQWRMSLLAWLHHSLGYAGTEELLADIRKTNEGFDSDGKSHICTRLLTSTGNMSDVLRSNLPRYDGNIAAHLTAMNSRRDEPITLRYFQYMAALYTEIYLDHYFRSPACLLAELNNFIDDRNQHRQRDRHYDKLILSDLKKLALWMATGSGKTLLLHLNYRQFLHYNERHGEPLDNILLVTPNEGLSSQHLAELNSSGIPTVRFDINQAMGNVPEVGLVQVTEITKLVEEKRGRGMRVPVETFEGNNLIFVDEGHKGAGGDVWRNLRDTLGKTGFTFEYSATFGQALAAKAADGLRTEYGKAIVFDYSYRHFYKDGYGKDFRILNLREQVGPSDADMLLLANMLSFHEQLHVFDAGGDKLHDYHLERPLWVFVGGSVNAVYTRDCVSRSDVLDVARFFHRVLSDPDWAISGIDKLMRGESGLKDEAKKDIFADKFVCLRKQAQPPAALYRAILKQTMHTDSGGGLKLCPLRGSPGELGLKASGANDYFGVIYIGDTKRFKDLVIDSERERESDSDSSIILEEDALADSLFNRINDTAGRTPPVHVLIGARKFIEGWNSWRVSNMGLLNMGRSEGSLIIQLFGRGVRLKGRGHSLKRSNCIDGTHPADIHLLETLNIFAVRADYMAQFRGYLEDEGADMGDMVQLDLRIRVNEDFLNQGLVIPRLSDHRQFQSDREVLLHRDDKNIKPISVIKTAVIQEHASAGEAGVSTAAASTGDTQPIAEDILDLVDWEAVYDSLVEYREEKGYRNLAIWPDHLRNIIAAGSSVYSLHADSSVKNPDTVDGRAHLQEAALSILRGYTDALYRHHLLQWESQNLEYQPLTKQDGNLRFNIGDGDGGDESSHYVIRVSRDNKKLIKEIENIINNYDDLYRNDQGVPSRIHFDRHLYQPLLTKDSGNPDTIISPPKLEPSECKFVQDLRDFWKNKGGEQPDDMELFLLRNLSRGSGVGFFNTSGFYPDFILWIKTDTRQRIVFIEPHGMIHALRYKHDEKARLHEHLKKMTPKINKRSGLGDIELDAYIVSATPHEELYKRYEEWKPKQYAKNHILFPEANGDHLKEIFQFPLPPASKASTNAKRNKRR